MSKNFRCLFSVLHHALYLRSSIYPSIIYAIGTNLCPIKGSIYWTQLYAKMTNLCTKVKKEKNAKKG